jgi:hypothetical protein
MYLSLSSPPTHGGRLLDPAWWAMLGIAVAYVIWAVLTTDRRQPGRIVVPGRVARMRLLRIAVCLPASAAISAIFVLAHDHLSHAAIVKAAGRHNALSKWAGTTSVHDLLIYGWAGLTVVIFVVLMLAASVIARLRTPLPPAPSGRRGSGRRPARRGAAQAWPPPGYYPPPEPPAWRMPAPTRKGRWSR